jgi:hypothetical protein
MDLQAARAIRAAQSRAWSQQLSEFPTWRPTPTRAEAQTKADNPANLVMLKAWDGSPIDSRAFNPDEPPGGPETPRVAVAPSGIEVVSTLEVGNELRAIIGGFNPPTIAYKWMRDGTAIAGANEPTYTLTGADVGAMIGLTIIFRTHQTADLAWVGPVVRALDGS